MVVPEVLHASGGASLNRWSRQTAIDRRPKSYSHLAKPLCRITGGADRLPLYEFTLNRSATTGGVAELYQRHFPRFLRRVLLVTSTDKRFRNSRTR